MDQSPLVIEQIDAGQKLVAELEKTFLVEAAFWLKASEEHSWCLYVAADRFKDKDLKVTYGEVLRVAATIRDPNLDPFRVKLVTVDHPFAKGALDIIRRFPGRMATHFHGKVLGGTSIDGAYIYPSPIEVS
jgi:hypothetical protein